jgi:alpha,alpha-trehalase
MTKIKAAIIDLDGVITQTAAVHALSWKKMFDAYNERRRAEGLEPFRPFSIERDYPTYIDGMPRYDGVATFLAARGVELPPGDPTDEPDQDTYCGLGNWKNNFFNEIVERDGVAIFTENVAVIRRWKARGLRTALVSSSKNAQPILRRAGLEDLFEVRIDGRTLAERNLPGKPAPDMFLAAAQALGVEPSAALVVEDALAGVAAGKAGGFRLVVGVGTDTAALKKNGADIVVSDLRAVRLDSDPEQRFEDLPGAFDHFADIAAFFREHTVLLSFDYDGTLTPIVAQPDQAIISDAMRDVVRTVAEHTPVAIVSGRDLRFIRQHMQLDNVYYAGSHGYEIVGPNDYAYELEAAAALLPLLDRTEEALQTAFAAIPGAEIERKRFAIAVHYRNVADDRVAEMEQTVVKLLQETPGLRKKGGKKVIEVQPALDWDKGKAVRLLYERLAQKEDRARPAYIGDDLTDEDAFREIRLLNGLTILVGDHGAPTYADYALDTVADVERLLKKLIEVL